MTLRVAGLQAWYGEAQALWGVSFDVAPGQIVGILGRNGAGKSTLLRCLAGLHGRKAGVIEFDGVAVAGQPAFRLAAMGIALVREGARLPSTLTVSQHLGLGARLAESKRQHPATIDQVWRWFPILEPLADRPAGLLSGGQRQALALAVALVSRPKLLLLDEPSAGLAPPVARELFQTIGRLIGEGISAVIVEQNPSWLEGLASHGCLLEIGRLIATGPIDELLERPASATF